VRLDRIQQRVPRLRDWIDDRHAAPDEAVLNVMAKRKTFIGK
jgi:hypothetical protein